ncbi:MAG: hypothetical protein HQL56_14875 [Magnetococcales bacterium]|nr:hypothetical protein [Magnetococcales bacterium]
MGDWVIYAPRLNRIRLKARNPEIVRGYGEGEVARNPALAFQLTERHIWKSLKMPCPA